MEVAPRSSNSLAAAMRSIAPEKALAFVSLGAFIVMMITTFAHGPIAMCALISVGLFHSIMFPTIFTLGIKGLGPLTEEGSGLLIMAIAGGALLVGAIVGFTINKLIASQAQASAKAKAAETIARAESDARAAAEKVRVEADKALLALCAAGGMAPAILLERI